jgi:hypothetical protein
MYNLVKGPSQRTQGRKGLFQTVYRHWVNHNRKIWQVYSDTRQNILDGNASPQEVVILRDGFSQFQIKYKVRQHGTP